VHDCEPLSAVALATVQFKPEGVETTLKLVPMPSALNVTSAFVDVPTCATVGAVTPLIVTVDPDTGVVSVLVLTFDAGYAVALPTGLVKPASVNDAAVPEVVAHEAGSVIATACAVTTPEVAVVHPVPVNPVPNVMAGVAGMIIPAPNVTVTDPAAGTAVPVKAAVHVVEVAPATVELGVTDTEVNPAKTNAEEPDVATVSAVVETV
jgi:hypothetical protein